MLAADDAFGLFGHVGFGKLLLGGRQRARAEALRVALAVDDIARKPMLQGMMPRSPSRAGRWRIPLFLRLTAQPVKVGELGKAG